MADNQAQALAQGNNPIGGPHLYCLAFSGGLDSTVLLHILSEWRKENPTISVRAVHIHHGLNPFADQWQEHCRSVCDELAIPFESFTVTIEKQKGDSLEKIARDARYEKLKTILKKKEVLLTAHHQDDQAETLLLQLLRGAGVKGLSAMPTRKPFAHSELVRPLLNRDRATLEEYANFYQLKWIEDNSNLNLDFDRNYLRHEIIPALKKRWPSLAKTFSRSANNCAEAGELLDELASVDIRHPERAQEFLSIKYLKTLSLKRQRNVLRYWLNNQVSKKQLDIIFKEVIDARPDKKPRLLLGDKVVRREKDLLFCQESEQSHSVFARIIKEKNVEKI